MIELLLHYRKVARHALNVLLGAVELHAATSGVPCTPVEGVPALVRALDGALASRRRPVVAWSFYTAGFAGAAAELRAVREQSGPGALHLAGGPHASAAPEEVLRAGFDLVVVGEGEETFPALLERLEAGVDVGELPGLAWLEEGRLRRTARAGPVDLDAFPPCAPRARPDRAPRESRAAASGHAGSARRPFCSGRASATASLREVRRWVRFHREIATRDLRFLSPSALSWGAPGDGCDVDAVEALLATAREEAGPDRRIFFGSFPSELRPEHVSARALALVRRYCDNRTVIVGGTVRLRADAAAMPPRARRRGGPSGRCALPEAGLEASVDVILGLPGEEEEDRAATRALLEQVAALGGRVHAHAFMPLPGSPWAAEPPGRIDARHPRAAGAARGERRRRTGSGERSRPGSPPGAADGRDPPGRPESRRLLIPING